MHLAVAIIGSLSIAAALALVFLLVWSALSRQFDLRTVQHWLVHRPFPFQLLAAFTLGRIAPLRLRAPRLAPWVWVAPAVWLSVRVAIWQSSSVLTDTSVWAHFFGSCPLYCADQFTVTLPFYIALAYSAAAFTKLTAFLQAMHR
jgi:hypothetical protein